MTPDQLMTALESERQRRQNASNRTSMAFNRYSYTWARVAREIGISTSTLTFIRRRRHVGSEAAAKCQRWIAGGL